MSLKRITEPFIWNSLHNTSYGKTWIQSNLNLLMKWRFKIESFGQGDHGKTSGRIFIGIASRDNRLNNNWMNCDDLPYCYFMITPRNIGKNMEFELELNTATAKLIRKATDSDYRETRNIVKNRDIRCKLAVCLTGQNAKITLIHYEISNDIGPPVGDCDDKLVFKMR